MTTDASQTRLADVAEVTAGTIPATPVWKIRRYTSFTPRQTLTTDISDEIRADRNVPDITKTGEMVAGDIATRWSYGTHHDWLERIMCANWAADVLKNGVLKKTAAFETTYVQPAQSSYVRLLACRWNTLGLTINARQPVRATWGIMGRSMADPATAIIAGATYTPASVTPDMNAGANVGSLLFTGIATPPIIQALSLNINNNIYQVDKIGAYEPHDHGNGRFDLTGSFTALFEDNATLAAIKAFDTVTIGFTLTDDLGNSEAWLVPQVKLLDGAPTVGGNNQPVTQVVPFQAKYDATSVASISITRTPAP